MHSHGQEPCCKVEESKKIYKKKVVTFDGTAYKIQEILSEDPTPQLDFDPNKVIPLWTDPSSSLSFASMFQSGSSSTSTSLSSSFSSLSTMFIPSYIPRSLSVTSIYQSESKSSSPFSSSSLSSFSSLKNVLTYSASRSVSLGPTIGEGGLYESVSLMLDPSYGSNPLQFYLGEQNRNVIYEASNEEIKLTGDICKANNLAFYVHAPLVCNLSKEWGGKMGRGSTGGAAFSYHTLKKELKIL